MTARAAQTAARRLEQQNASLQRDLSAAHEAARALDKERVALADALHERDRRLETLRRDSDRLRKERDEAVSKLSAERSKAKRHAEEALLRKQEHDSLVQRVISDKDKKNGELNAMTEVVERLRSDLDLKNDLTRERPGARDHERHREDEVLVEVREEQGNVERRRANGKPRLLTMCINLTGISPVPRQRNLNWSSQCLIRATIYWRFWILIRTNQHFSVRRLPRNLKRFWPTYLAGMRNYNGSTESGYTGGASAQLGGPAIARSNAVGR